MHIGQILALVCVMLAISACGENSLAFLNTVTPTPSLTATPTRTPVPPSEPPGVRPWNNLMVDRICLEQEYSSDMPAYIKVEPDYSPGKIILETLAGMNIQVVSPGYDCDANLSIELYGKALSTPYSGWGDLYTGGEVRGLLRLTAPDRKTLTYKIEQTEWPPEQVSIMGEEGPEKPTDYFLSFLYLQRLHDILVELWGPQAAFWGFSFGYQLPAESWQDAELLKVLYIEALTDAHGQAWQAIRSLSATELRNNPLSLAYLADLLYQIDGQQEKTLEIVVRYISDLRDIYEKDVVRMLVDCVKNQRHQQCRSSLNSAYGLVSYELDDPKILEDWFFKKFP